jgi:predicted DCC family thiol-disulfide oxidoreductase YuxK
LQIPATVERDLGRSPADGPVVFYDGGCGLCHSWVAFLIARDPTARLRFATIQGAYAAEHLPAEVRDVGPDGTIVLLEPGARVSTRSRAVLRALSHLGGRWRLAGWLAVVPGLARVLDLGYGVVTRNRDRWFGRTDQCPVPDPALRSRFLD